MTRQRAFCVYCGCVISAGARSCHNHAYLRLHDPNHGASVPADPATELPTLAARLGEATSTREGKAI